MQIIKRAPFLFGKLASANNFTNRQSETKHLINNTHAGTSTILISPRRWGKSSLVKKAAEQAQQQDKKLKVCFLDVYTIRSEKEFYQKFAEVVLQVASSKWSDVLSNAKKYLSAFIPKISVSPDGINNFSLSLNPTEVKKNADELLDLPEKIAQEKKIRFLICIDEFQNISTFKNSLAFQKKLRAHWQQHQHIIYCLYGSKRHMMMDLFSSQSMPFYKFGDLIFLEKIKESDWQKFIKKRFTSTGKRIEKETALLICQLAECHSYYVQQLAQLSWFRTKDICTEEIVRQAHEGLVNQLSLLFQNMTDRLSNVQIRYLHALVDGVKQLTAKETISVYEFGTSANALKAKNALIKKEIIDDWEGSTDLLDPMYKSWLKGWYFTR